MSVSPLAPGRFPPLPPVPGARFSAVAAELRYRGRPDLGLAVFEPGTAVAGMFTRNRMPGHPVRWCRRILPRGRARALIANAGNANVCRGAEGDAAVLAEVRAVAAACGCLPEEVFVASTGVIGERLPVERITARVPELVSGLAADGMPAFARAIMTTDTFPKGAFGHCRIGGAPVTVAGVAKGSGMIAPDMATMLAFLVTDACLPAPVLQSLLEHAVERSFHAITVDSDTSTSDTVLLFATGRAAHPAPESDGDPVLEPFRDTLAGVAAELARQIVRDGEGASKFITIHVRGARDHGSARRIGLSIANSPLVKTAIAGEDANWGRIVMAVGKAREPVDPERLAIRFGGHLVAHRGMAVPELDEAPVAEHLRGREIEIEVEVGVGDGSATVWTCDLTHGYIDINASYRS